MDLQDIPPLRKLAWRLGRKLYCWARREPANDPNRNGEYWLLGEVASRTSGDGVYLDIGANRGDWTNTALGLLAKNDWNGQIYSFEPSTETFQALSERLGSRQQVQLVEIALSDVDGSADFFTVGRLAGTNSLYEVDGSTPNQVSVAR